MIQEYSFEKYGAVHRPAALKLATKLSGNKAHAEDIVQDALLKMYRAWDRFKPGTDPQRVAKAWLMHIVTMQFINTVHQKNQKRKQLDHVTDVLIGTYGQQEDGRDPRRSLSDGVGDEVESALATIGPQFRDAIRRYTMQDQSCKQIAEETGVPAGTVISRLHRARKALRPLLTRYAKDWYRVEDEEIQGTEDHGDPAG